MNYFKAAEQVLSSVPALERALENLQHRRDRLIESGAPREPGAILQKRSASSQKLRALSTN